MINGRSMTKKHKHGLMVGRFQPFHKGHERVVRRMLDECEYVTVAIGSAQESGTEKNPYDYYARFVMIDNLFSGHRFYPMQLDDINDPSRWANYVLNNVNMMCYKSEAVDAYYCGFEEDGKLFADAGVTVVITPRQELGISGTQIRELIAKGDDAWKQYVHEVNHKLVENG